MDFQKVENFVRKHWPAALMVVVITAPSVWGIAQAHYNERITVLDMRVQELTKTIDELNERVAVLDQLAARKLETSGTAFSAAELYTPSATVPPQRK